MALKDEIQNMKTIEQGVANNKVVNFAYTNKAYTDNEVNGVDVYDFNNDNNIPTNNPDVIKVNPTVIAKGYRAQASSITRMLVNHIFGRVSYNLNKTVDLFTSLLDKLGNAIGESNGIATLDVDGRIPYSQLPETAVEYKGEWNAETNTPTLVDGTGTKGDMYYVSTDGTQDLGSGDIVFLAGDRIIYNGTVWQKLSGGSVKKVNQIRPDDTGNVTLGWNDIEGALPVSKGGTGATTVKEAEYNLFNSIPISDVAYKDDTSFACIKNVPTTTDGVLVNKKASGLWMYIQSKISSVLGLTASTYNGKANTAGTADLGQVARAGNVYTCSTASATSAKTLTITGFTLSTGYRISVLFTNGNSVSTPTLNVNNTGAKQIRGWGSLALSSQYGSTSAGCYTWSNKTVLELFYDGTYWQVIGNPVVYQMGTGNFLKIHLNGYKEGSYNYSFTPTYEGTSRHSYEFYESEVVGSTIASLKIPLIISFIDLKDYGIFSAPNIVRNQNIAYRYISGELSGAGVDNVTLSLVYAGY